MSTMNRNPALNTSFLLEIPLYREVNYFIQTAEVPGLTMSGVDTPFMNYQGNVPSNRIDYDQLNLTMIVDEDWENWYSIVKWMQRIRRNNTPITEDMSDMTLHLFNSVKGKGKRLYFHGAYPVLLGSIPLDSTQTDVNPLVCSLAIRYQDYELLDEID